MADALHTAGLNGGLPVTSAAEARLNDGGLVAVQGPGALDIRTGVMVGPSSAALVTGTSATSPMTYSIAPHHWVTSRGSASGPYRGTCESAQTVSTTAAPASGSRIDVLYVKQQDSDSTVPTPDGTTAPLYGVVQGTSTTGTPVKPSLPPGAEELGQAVVAAGATSTNSAQVTISNTARQAVARGARIPVRSQAERDALTLYKGLEVYRLDTGAVELNTTGTSGGWVVTNPTEAPSTITYPSGTYKALVDAEYEGAELDIQGSWARLQGAFTSAVALSGGAAQTIYTWGQLPAGTYPAGTQKFPASAFNNGVETTATVFVKQSGALQYLLHSAGPVTGLTVSISGIAWRIGA